MNGREPKIKSLAFSDDSRTDDEDEGLDHSDTVYRRKKLPKRLRPTESSAITRQYDLKTDSTKADFEEQLIYEKETPDGRLPQNLCGDLHVFPHFQRFPYPPYQHINLVPVVSKWLPFVLVASYLAVFCSNTWLLVKEKEVGMKVSNASASKCRNILI